MTNEQSIIDIFAGLRRNVDSHCIAEDFFDLLGGIGKFFKEQAYLEQLRASLPVQEPWQEG